MNKPPSGNWKFSSSHQTSRQNNRIRRCRRKFRFCMIGTLMYLIGNKPLLSIRKSRERELTDECPRSFKSSYKSLVCAAKSANCTQNCEKEIKRNTYSETRTMGYTGVVSFFYRNTKAAASPHVKKWIDFVVEGTTWISLEITNIAFKVRSTYKLQITSKFRCLLCVLLVITMTLGLAWILRAR